MLEQNDSPQPDQKDTTDKFGGLAEALPDRSSDQHADRGRDKRGKSDRRSDYPDVHT